MTRGNRKIIILGGGISGITTALTLQLFGYDTVIYAEQLVSEETPLNPEFASLYPAASVIPHSIQSSYLQTLFPASQRIFELLLQNKFQSIELQRHFEVFEFPVDFPSYTNHLYRCSSINDVDVPIPHRADAPDELQGWVFDCFVAKWPHYMDQLYSLYNEAGGIIKKQKIEKDEIPSLPTDIIINCTGVWSNELFDDAAEWQLIRGHLVHIKNQHPITDPSGTPYSYNYTPLRSVYATPGGSPSDVYFYPISDRWVLGGSRQPGILDSKRNWNGRQHEDTIVINGIEVPRQILELNNNILNTTYKESINYPDASVETRLGYRFTRGDSNGIRMEAELLSSKQVIHNYGHGGAGVTLSWGCALRVFHLLTTIDNSDHKRRQTSDILRSLQRELGRVYLEYF